MLDYVHLVLRRGRLICPASDAPFAGFCLVVQREWHTIYDDPDSDSDACASGSEPSDLQFDDYDLYGTEYMYDEYG